MSSWLNVVTAAGITALFTGSVFAQASFSADLNSLQAGLTVQSVNSTFNPNAVGQQMSGLGSIPFDVSGLAVSSPTEMAGKGAAQLAYCNTTPRSSMTAGQQSQCDAALAIAGLADRKLSTGGSSPSRTANWAAQQEKSILGTATTQSVGVAPATTSSPGQCQTTQIVVPGDSRQETCSGSYAVTPQSCTNTLSVQFDTQVDPVTGEVTAINVKDLWTNNCQTLAANTDCDNDSVTCDIGPLCKTINGVQICRDCWQKTQHYTCYATSGGVISNDCGSMAANGCQQISQSCGLTRSNGQCVDWSYVYQCPRTSQTIQAVTQCSGQNYCIGSLCFDTTKTPDKDFAMAAAYMEMGREAGVYMTGSGSNIELFRGDSANCTRPVGFMSAISKNCCFQSSGGKTNANITGNNSTSSVVGGVVFSTLLDNAVSIGSHYMYDFMFTNDFFSERALEAIKAGNFNPEAGLMDLLRGPSLSMYGFTLAPSGGMMLPGTVPIQGGEFSIVGQNYSLTFNPYILAAVVILQVYSELQTCAIDEQMLAVRRGKGLCSHQSTYCSRRLPWPLNTCIQETEVWCCWNSRLAETIAIQGKCQLYGECGGKPGVSGCRGFTQAEFNRLDFSKINLSAFMNDANALGAANTPSPAVVNSLQGKVFNQVTQQATDILQNNTQK